MNSKDCRPWHKLRSNKGERLPHHLVFLDTETQPEPHPTIAGAEIHHFRLGVANYVRFERSSVSTADEFFFQTPVSFWHWLEKRMYKGSSLWLFAHNVCFDLTVLHFWDRLESGEYRLADDDWPIRGLKYPGRKGKRPWRGMLVLEDPPVIITVRKGDSTLHIVDTLNYWPESLATLGESIGVRKMKMPERDDGIEDWYCYCRNDVRIIREAVIGLLTMWSADHLGNWAPTAPSLSWNAYNHKFRAHEIFIHGDRETLKLERSAYYGGQCECYYQGSVCDPQMVGVLRSEQSHEDFSHYELSHIYHLDVNSLYPYVMSIGEYPTKLKTRIANMPLKDLQAIVGVATMIAEVEIETKHDTYPVRTENGVIHATGHYRTVLATPELRRACASGHVLSCNRVAIYDSDHIFLSFVDHFWRKRCECVAMGDAAGQQLCKTLMNSLFGKWGQKSRRWEDCSDGSPPAPYHQWWRQTGEGSLPQLFRSIGWHCQRKGIPGEGRDSFPAISAHITSYAREYMLRLRTLAGAKNVYYQDTDSLHVSSEGYAALAAANFVNLNDIGELKIVESANVAKYNGYKDYVFGGRRVLGCVSRRAVKTGDNTYSQLEFPGARSMIATRPSGQVIVRRVDKTVRLPKIRGTVGPDGWITPPSYTGDYKEFSYVL